MVPSCPELRAVLDAAEALVEARAAQMVTRVEWTDLERALAAAREMPCNERAEAFAAEGGYLVRRVEPAGGVPYARRCPRDAFEAIVRAVAAFEGAAFVLGDLCARSDVSRSLGLVAMAFLKARGRIVNTNRGTHAATRGFTVQAALDDYGGLGR